MSTAYYPEPDGRTQRVNAVIEQVLCFYVSYQQDGEVRWLPMAEFTGNNQETGATKATLFFTNYRFHAHIRTRFRYRPWRQAAGGGACRSPEDIFYSGGKDWSFYGLKRIIEGLRQCIGRRFPNRENRAG